MNLKVLIGCWCLMGIFQTCYSEQVGANVLDCLKEEMCEADGGLARGTYCAELMSEKDIKIMIQLMKKFCPDATTVADLIGEVCKDFDQAIKAVYYWFDEKEKMNVTYTAEESQKIVDSRACYFLMVSECEIKKALGFGGFW